MHLLPCNRPQGSLEQAPRTSLRPLGAGTVGAAQERWEGFWCIADERYYTQCIRGDGSVQWYRIQDSREAKVLRFRRPLYVSVRGTSYVGTSCIATNDAPGTLTKGVPRTLTHVAPRTLTQVAPRSLTQLVRRTIIVGRYGRRSLLVWTSRGSRRAGGVR